MWMCVVDKRGVEWKKVCNLDKCLTERMLEGKWSKVTHVG